MKIHLIILLLFNVVIGYGKDHEVDSLLNVIYNSPKDSNTVHLALKISDKLQFKSLDYTIRFAKESLLISEQLQWIYGMGRSNEKIGRAYWNLGKYDSALYYHFRALNDYKKGKYWKNYWDIVVMIGQDYANSSQFNLAIQYLNIALNAYKKENNIGGVAYTSGILSWVYSSKGDYVKSSEMILEQIKISEKKGDTLSMAFSYFSLANVYLNLKKYKETEDLIEAWYPIYVKNNNTDGKLDYNYIKAALSQVKKDSFNEINYLMKAKEISYSMMHKYFTGVTFSKIGDFYFSKNNIHAAIIAYDSAKYCYESLNQVKDITSLNCKKTKCYVLLGEIDKAKAPIDSASKSILTFDSKASNLEFYQAKYMYDSASRNWESAFKYRTLYDELASIQFNNDNMQQLIEMQLNYEANKKEEKYKSTQKITNSILGFTIILFLILLTFYILVSRKNQKIRAQFAIQKTMLHEIHHRVKNNLQLIASFMQLQINKTDDLHAKDSLEESVKNIQVISLVHENLYKHSSNLVNLPNYIQQLSSSIISILNLKNNLKIDVQCENISLNIDQTIPLGLIINELVTNSIKHAFNKKNEQIIVDIQIYRVLDVFHFKYSDNGTKNIVREIEKSNSGLKLIKMLVQEVKGIQEIDGQHGFKFHLYFPL